MTVDQFLGFDETKSAIPAHTLDRPVRIVVEVAPAVLVDLLRARPPRRTGSKRGPKLTEEDVRVIRRRLADGETGAAVARDFGISEESVRRVRHRATWAWVD